MKKWLQMGTVKMNLLPYQVKGLQLYNIESLFNLYDKY